VKVVGCALIGPDGNTTEETGVWKTKKDLLISYDMMPLRGLEQCENHLQSKGMIPTEVEIVVNDNHHHGLSPSVSGIPDIDMMDYGGFGTSEKRVLDAIVLYLSDGYKGRGVERFNITKEEQNILNSFVFFDVIKVKGTTRKKAFEKLQSEIDSILHRTEIVIEKVELRKIKEDLK